MLLSRYAREEDVIVGTEHAIRRQAELEGVMDCAANSLALRTDLSGLLTAALVCQLGLQPTQLIGERCSRALRTCAHPSPCLMLKGVRLLVLLHVTSAA